MNPFLVVGIVAILVGIIAIIAAFLPNERRDEPGVQFRRIAFQVIIYGLVPIVAGGFFFAAGWSDR